MPTVFLTGASGFLGKHMLRSAISADWNVLALVHSHPLSPGQSHAAVRTVSVHEASSRGWAAILTENQIDAVYHLAAFIPADHSDPAVAEQCLQVNALLTLDLLRASIEVGIGKFIYFSAGNAYAPSLDRPAKETDPVYPVSRSPFYLGSKMLGELFVEHGLAIKQRSPFPHTVVAELTNDLIMYQPTREAFKQQGYETLVGPNRVSIKGIEAIVNTSVGMLQELWGSATGA